MRRRWWKKVFLSLFLLNVVFLTRSFNSFHRRSKEKPEDFLRPYRYSISCEKLFENRSEALPLLTERPSHPILIADEDYIFTTDRCSSYLSLRFNESFHRSDELKNREFPLAFTILLHENVEQFERLLRLIYRPQNFYCIHIDADASVHVLRAIQSISQCFSNVFIVSRRENVVYTTFSRLQADLNCMEDLIRYPSWKYLLNVANSELPLRTNSELVEIFKIYRGFNDIEGRWKSRRPKRTDYVWLPINGTKKTHVQQLRKTNRKKSPPPGHLKIVKGSAYGAFSRGFVEFILKDPLAREFLNWSRDTFSPDEHYWATLNYNPHLNAPGGYRAKTDPTQWTARFVNWGEYRCHGRIQRGICVFGLGDLPLLASRPELFANKFRLNIDPIAYQCQEERILSRSIHSEQSFLNLSFYHQMPFLLH